MKRLVFIYHKVITGTARICENNINLILVSNVFKFRGLFKFLELFVFTHVELINSF